MQLNLTKLDRESYLKYEKQGIMMMRSYPELTAKEKSFIAKGAVIIEKYGVFALLEKDGIDLIKPIGKGKKANMLREGKTNDELRSEYPLFRGKTDEEMQEIYNEYDRIADNKIQEEFDKLYSKELEKHGKK